MRAYLLGVLCAAFICSIVTAVGGEGQRTRKLVCGIFLALALLHPIGGIELPKLTVDPFLEDAEAAVQHGVSQARAAKNDIITESLEAYILTKAAGLGLEVTAEVSLTADGLPASVTLTGSASPSERETLVRTITSDLGIGKEDLTWKEIYQSSE